jgi:hypothetical protein
MHGSSARHVRIVRGQGRGASGQCGAHRVRLDLDGVAREREGEGEGRGVRVAHIEPLEGRCAARHVARGHVARPDRELVGVDEVVVNTALGTRRVRLVREEGRGVSSQNVSDALRDSQEGWATTSACLYGITRKRISPRVLEGTHLERLRRARALVGDRDRRRDQLRVDDTPLGARALGAGAEREVAGLCARVEPGTEPDRFT